MKVRRPIPQEVKLMHSRCQNREEHSKVESNKTLDFLKGEIAIRDHHLIHPGMQEHFMVTITHVLTMDIEMGRVGNIIEV